MKYKKPILSLSILTLSIGNLSAALIAQYDFTDGDLTDNELGASYTLTHTTTGSGGVTINPNGSATFTGVEANKGYLETVAFGTTGVANFTVSFWFKASTFAQGNFQGLFSTNSSAASFSSQLDSSGPNIRFVSAGNSTLTYADSNLSVDTWYHTVIRKETGAGANYTQVYITEEGAAGPTLVMNQNANPGGLNQFRFGVNRNSDSLFGMDMANVKIYNDATVNLTTLLTEGPSLTVIPEPTTSALMAVAGLGLLARRKR